MMIGPHPNWKRLDDSQNKEYEEKGIPSMHCTKVFTTKSDSNTKIIFYEYSKASKEQFAQLENAFDEINRHNELIDGKPSDKDYDDTSILSCIYYTRFEIGKTKALINITRVYVDDNTHDYVCQIHFIENNILQSVQYTMKRIDTKHIAESLKTDAVFNEILEYIKG